MVELNPIQVNEDGALVRNIIWFARALRKSGLPVGPGQVIAEVGDSGSLEGSQLYFELRKGKDPQDPSLWFAQPAR